jgi:hypothetical protein
VAGTSADPAVDIEVGRVVGGAGAKKSCTTTDLGAEPKIPGPIRGLRSLVAQLRGNAARHPADETIAPLAEELSDARPEFARLWRLHEVGPNGPHGRLPIAHPDVGLLVFDEIDLTPDGYPDLTLVVLLPDAATSAGVGAMTST